MKAARAKPRRATPRPRSGRISEPLLSLLACPLDKSPLDEHRGGLVCQHSHKYKVEDGIPILHPENAKPGFWGMAGKVLPTNTGKVDAFVQHAIGATGGFMYIDRIGKLTEYPIPEFPLSEGEGKTLLDIGCNWGRWSLAAAQKGYRVVGMDPHLDAIKAAMRVKKQLGIEVDYVVGDGRYLPFRDNSFDRVFSYSVLQHFSPADVAMVLERVNFLLRENGQSWIQMANAFGLRSLYHQFNRNFRVPKNFEVRYWPPPRLQNEFETRVGETLLLVDGFFSVNVQPKDAPLLSPKYRYVLKASQLMKTLSRFIPGLKYFADSLYVVSIRD